MRADSPETDPAWPGSRAAGAAAPVARAVAPVAGRPPASAPPAWYAHRFNNATSLRLILGIIPRLPRLLVPPIGMVTTTICLALMRDERRAVVRNQARILGVRGWRLALAVWRQFYCFSRLMVSYCDLLAPERARLQERLSAGRDDENHLRAALDRGRGVVVLTAHIGNWEVGAHFLARFGVPINMVMQANRMSAAERWLMRRRESAGVRVIRIGTNPTAMLAMREALRRGEIVAAQGDRAPNERSLDVTLFGGRFRVPIGPFLLARLSEAPLVPAFVIQDGWWRWRAEVGDPILVAANGDQTAALATAASRYAEVLERIVRRHPDQWFNFYDVWGEASGDA